MSDHEINELVSKAFNFMMATSEEGLGGDERRDIACDFLDGLLEDMSLDGASHDDERKAASRFWAKCEAKRFAGEICGY